MLVGIVALVAEFGQALLDRAENQRVADLAAYSGAVAFTATSSNTAMAAAANRVVTLNGIAATDASVQLVPSPRDEAAQAVNVAISTTRPLFLAPILGFQNFLPVGAEAFVQLGGSTPPCIIALSPAQTGVTLTGGTTVNAPECAVASNAAVSVPCGTRINTITVNYDSASPPSQPCGGIAAPAGRSLTITRGPTADPLATYAGVTTATARHATVAALAAPAAPAAPTVSVTGGTDLDFPWWNDTGYFGGKLPSGCAQSYASGWIITCAAGKSYTFGTVKIQHAVRLALTGSGATTFNFRGTLSINNGAFEFPAATYNFAKGLEVNSGANVTFGAGTFNVAESMTIHTGTSSFGAGTYTIGQRLLVSSGTVTFGDGTYNIRQGMTTNGGTTTTFGAGTFNIGASTASCSGATYSVCHTGTTLTFGGPSTFAFAAGLYNNGGSTMVLGSGTTNSYRIGPSSGGNAIFGGGGSKTRFADAIGTGKVFELGGNLNMANGGGSCMTLPAAAQHDIKGYVSTAGGTRLGAGVYTVNGYIALGANGGGDVSCDGSTVGIEGTGVTLVASGATTPSSWTCSGVSFCIGAGYGNVRLSAPTGGDTAKLVVVGPSVASGITAGATFAEGAGTTFSGAMYFPIGPITLSGGASVGNGPGECLQIIGSRVTLSGGTKAASACITNSTGGAIVLVE